MEPRKRQRLANFTPQEKQTLLGIISKFKNIIENKKTDSVSNEEKAKIWQKIVEEFNAMSPGLIERTVDSLKKIYDNKKKEVRKQVAEEKKEILLTGGGSLPKIVKDPDQDLILSIVDPTTIFGIHNIYDSDANMPSTSVQNNDVVMEFTQAEDREDEIDQNRDDEDSESDSETDETRQRQKVIVLDEDEIDENVDPNPLARRRYKAADLKSSKSDGLNIRQKNGKKVKDGARPNLTRPKFDSSRRRPAVTVRALSSNNLAEKYDRLVEKKLVIANFEEVKVKNEIDHKKKESALKLELLHLEIELKKEQIKVLRIRSQNTS